jgi:hypothetical protein
MKSGNLNFLEPSGPLQASNGTAYILHSGGATHLQSTGYYAGDKNKSQSGKKIQQISFSETDWERVNLVTFPPVDYNGVID